MKMKMKNNLGLTILGIAIFVIPIRVTALHQQQAYAPRSCGSCVEFIKGTHEFEKNMIAAISEGTANDEDNADLDEFVLFMRSTLSPDSALDTLISNYEDGVRRILSAPPPDDGKPHDQIKEFKQLTHTLRTEVLELAHRGFLNEPR